MKTAELIGNALDWAVTKAEGFNTSIEQGETWGCWGWATDWTQGGAIIEREGISIYLDTNNLWQANIFDGNPAVFGTGVEGSTPLIAAMRCYVASQLGDEVDVPDEVLKGLGA